MAGHRASAPRRGVVVRLRRHQRTRGHRAGARARTAAARAESAPILETLEAIVREAAGARDVLAEALELRVAELAVLIAQKVLGATVEARPEAVLEVVGAALRRGWSVMEQR